MDKYKVSMREVRYKRPRSKSKRIAKKWEKRYGVFYGLQLITNKDFTFDENWYTHAVIGREYQYDATYNPV